MQLTLCFDQVAGLRRKILYSVDNLLILKCPLTPLFNDMVLLILVQRDKNIKFRGNNQATIQVVIVRFLEAKRVKKIKFVTFVKIQFTN